MTTVALTGVAGAVGRSLVERLAADPSIERIVGIDVIEPTRRPPKLTFHRLDIRSSDLAKAMVGCDAVVHLAFLFGGTDELREVNLGGLRNLLGAMDTVGARQLVYPSTAFVYGAYPGAAVPYDEDAAIQPNQGSGFAEQKTACEAEIAAWRTATSGSEVAVLRLAPIFGPTSDSPYTRLLEAPLLLAVNGHGPALSVLHEDDAASALHFALSQRLHGVYNVATDRPIPHRRLVELSGRREVPVPEALLRGVLRVLAALGLSDITPGELPYHMHSWVVDNTRLRDAGWSPDHTAEETVAETVDAHSGYRSIGVLRATRRQWAHALIGSGSLFAAGAGAAALAMRQRSRRRRKARRQPLG